LFLSDIHLAYIRIEHFIRKTPLEYSIFFSKQTNSKVLLKLENLQITGSFKLRGVLNSTLQLNKSERERGIVTVSAGNHGRAMAYGTNLLNINATIMVPNNTPENQIRAIKYFNKNLIITGSIYDETEKIAKEYAKRNNMIFISPYNNESIIAGNGTIALEILNIDPEIDILLVPVGGGGLLSGSLIAVKNINPSIKIYGVQSESSPVMFESVKKGQIVKIPIKKSIAHGLHGGIEEGSITFKIIKKYVDGILLVSESEIKQVMKDFIFNHNQLIEGSGAVGLAAIKRYPNLFKNKKIAIIISGGNIDHTLLKNLICEKK
jgi:threonine dehydratase